MKEVLTLEEISMRYDMEIRYVDREIGLLLNRLDELKLLKSSILIFTSDHGENLGDHHSVGHIHDLYDTLIKIPLIIKFPGCTVAARYQEIVSLIDIFPTIMDLAGLPVPAGLRGESIMPLLSGKSRVTHQFHYAETYPPEAKFQKNAIRTTDWKLIKTSDPMLLELYDLKKYPDESNNLAQHMKEKSENLLKTLESCIAELNSRIPTENNSTAKKDVEFLKALGYRE
jgi:arylsulfatase A-like enzyme